jgi:nitroimidazol reductase NimA-like FMN-containing flavoprotein (pyridoxamine 5'-phosphate oxidase superfamily)
METSEPTDHRGLQVLGPDECNQLLSATPIGRVAFMHAGQPTILPVTYAYVNHGIVFRTGVGAKLEAAARREVMGFEIDDWDPAEQTGWSIVISGRADLVADEVLIAEYEAMGLPEWVQRDRVAGWVRIAPTQISGRRLT